MERSLLAERGVPLAKVGGEGSSHADSGGATNMTKRVFGVSES